MLPQKLSLEEQLEVRLPQRLSSLEKLPQNRKFHHLEQAKMAHLPLELEEEEVSRGQDRGIGRRDLSQHVRGSSSWLLKAQSRARERWSG